MDLQGKTVLFIGGLGGIAFETSKILFAKNLKHLIILDKDERPEILEELRSFSADCQLHFYKFDVTADKLVLQEILEDILKKVDAIDVLIYGAGICNDKLYELTVQVNFAGLVKAVSVILPHMDKRNGGRGGMVISISSMSGLDPISFYPVYSATKSAVISFTRALANPKMFEQTNVSFICVCPGGTDTPLSRNSLPFSELKILDNSIVDGDREETRFQGPDECGRNLVAAIEKAQNGAIWMLDMGSMELMVPQHYWVVSKMMKDYMA